jgi:hypothetical protein
VLPWWFGLINKLLLIGLYRVNFFSTSSSLPIFDNLVSEHHFVLVSDILIHFFQILLLLLLLLFLPDQLVAIGVKQHLLINPVKQNFGLCWSPNSFLVRFHVVFAFFDLFKLFRVKSFWRERICKVLDVALICSFEWVVLFMGFCCVVLVQENVSEVRQIV